MCRHLAYLGRERTLHELVYAPPYSLNVQAYAPRLSRYCRLNADGFGVGWYVGGRTAPVRFRRAQPMWTDVSFAGVAEVVSASCVVAAVRSATEGFPVDESCAQPFTADRWLFSHNGVIEGFAYVEAKLRDLVGDAPADGVVPDARAPVDSALLFAMSVVRWRRGRALGDALGEVVTEVAGIAAGRLNLLAADGTALAATAHGDTLFVREDDDGVVLASEPHDDEPGWRRVPDGSLVTVDAGGVEVSAL